MFRTEIKCSPNDFLIGLSTPILSVGSCFANEMGQRLQTHKFDIQTNPGGILFNPCSIFRLMEMALKDEKLPDWSFTEKQGISVNYLLHSDMSAPNATQLNLAVKSLLAQVKERILKSRVIILTYGTAFVYKLRQNGAIVANCHKVPQNEFEKVLLTQDEIVNGFRSIKALIEAQNPNVQFLLTVSPVRHIKEGLPQNNVSKSTLRLACHQLSESETNVSYFPSYEIMMDDLRDYRFYEKDLIHPNEQALDYIWQQFSGACLDHAAKAFVAEWSKIRSALAHKPFHAGSEEHQKFLSATLEKLQKLVHLVDVSEEVAYLQGQLNRS